ncbi:hypothetical protein SAMN04487996_10356 [Dyadobacter soli]|uniref:Uncharacterized protein n=1 Tax=Dyadobacter soli TaxID=659014 RepID=A0A1G6Z9Y8_9BACT|nr:hypothetical protein [Dyadobacter soli]SDD99103.1 hypothetical protein SAMN04487996_10356 [Dyadobacter soli]
MKFVPLLDDQFRMLLDQRFRQDEVFGLNAMAFNQSNRSYFEFCGTISISDMNVNR